MFLITAKRVLYECFCRQPVNQIVRVQLTSRDFSLYPGVEFDAVLLLKFATGRLERCVLVFSKASYFLSQRILLMQAIYSDLGTRGSIPLYKVFKLLPVRLVGCAGAQANGKPSTNEAPRVGGAGVDNPTVRASNHEYIFLAAAESFDKPIHDKSSVRKFQSRTMV